MSQPQEQDRVPGRLEAFKGMSKPRSRFAPLMAIVLTLAAVGALLGSVVVLIDVWRRPDVVATTTAQASVSNPADSRAQTVR